MSTTNKYCCIVCHKQYTRKASYDNHKIVCEFKMKTKRDMEIEEEELGDVPTHSELVKIVQELTKKIIRMEEQMEDMKKWVDKKKKKLNVIVWLNTNITPTIGFLEWVNSYITVKQEHFEDLMTNTLYTCVQKVFEDNLEETDAFIHPIKAFNQKSNAFYIYEQNEDGTPNWQLMDTKKLGLLFKTVQIKIIRVLTKWKDENKHKFHDVDKIAELFNKAVIKLMNMSFEPNNSFSRMKTSLYNYLKKDLITIMDYEFEF